MEILTAFILLWTDVNGLHHARGYQDGDTQKICTRAQARKGSIILRVQQPISTQIIFKADGSSEFPALGIKSEFISCVKIPTTKEIAVVPEHWEIQVTP